MIFNEEQNDALLELRAFLLDPAAKEFGLFGPAGSGKTTVLVRMASLPEARHLRVLFTAPTHKATRVLHDMSTAVEARMSCRTLQSALAMFPRRVQGKDVFIQTEAMKAQAPVKDVDVLIVDECSMIGSDMYEIILDNAAFHGFKVIFTGDSKQLPPVGEEDANGGVSRTFNTQWNATLNKVERSGGYLSKVNGAVRQMVGMSALKPRFKSCDEVTRILDTKAFENEFLRNVDDAKLLAWTNSCVLKLNDVVHRRLYGNDAPPFRKGDEVYAAHSRYEWAAQQRFVVVDAGPWNVNGLDCWRVDVAEVGSFMHKDGRFEDVVRSSSFPTFVLVADQLLPFNAECNRLAGLANEAQDSRVRREAWQDFHDYKKSFHDVRRRYAMTVHASQGSTYQKVFVCERNIFRCKDPLLRSKLLYVAYSRAAERLVVC